MASCPKLQFTSLLFVVLCLSAALALPPLEFPIRHRQAPDSPFRRPSPSLPDSLPLKLFLEFGLSLRSKPHRSTHPHPSPLRARFTYNQQPAGDFYLPLAVGNPPQQLSFTLDTGSELSWTLCSPCRLCDSAGVAAFRFARSSSNELIPCTSPLCLQSLGFIGGVCSNTSAKACLFELQYGDGSADLGYLTVDDFHFSKVAVPVVFGCAVVDLESVPSSSSGIIGLNAGPFSLPSQLSSRGYAKKFAYCLPDRVYNLNSSGLLRFGDSASPSKLRYTPLVPPFSPLGYLYYYVGLTGISLGNQLLDIPFIAFGTTEFGGGGTILDSGTAITHLAEPIYRPVIEALKEATIHLDPFPFADAGADLCYNISITATALPKLPKLVFHFLDEVDLELESDSILYPAIVVGNIAIVCAAFASSSSTPLSSINIIGNYQQQNYWIEYDLTSSRVGFAKANCAMS